MSVTVTVDGEGRRIHFDWEAAAGMWLAWVSPIVTAAIKVKAPVGRQYDPNGPKPGRLRDSITPRVERTAGVASLIVYSDVKYAKFVIGGTRPHPIVPRNAQVLHWYAADGEHFSRYVNHPGTKPNDFAAKAVSPLTPLLIELFARAAKEAIY